MISSMDVHSRPPTSFQQLHQELRWVRENGDTHFKLFFPVLRGENKLID